MSAVEFIVIEIHRKDEDGYAERQKIRVTEELSDGYCFPLESGPEEMTITLKGASGS